MLYYDKIDISEGIDPAKSNRNKECMICHYWFFNQGFKFQDPVCNSCHDLAIFCLDISNVVVITGKSVDYCWIIHNFSNFEAISLLENSVLEDRGIYKEILPDIWFGAGNLKNAKHVKKKITEELMPIAWHTKRWWNFCLTEDETKEMEPTFTE